jgi:hypothetical protein
MAPLRSVVPGSNFLPDAEIDIGTRKCQIKQRASCINFEPRRAKPEAITFREYGMLQKNFAKLEKDGDVRAAAPDIKLAAE